MATDGPADDGVGVSSGFSATVFIADHWVAPNASSEGTSGASHVDEVLGRFALGPEVNLPQNLLQLS